MAVSRPHALSSAAAAQSATSSATFNDIGVFDLVSAAVARAATSSGTFLRSFPGAHDIIVLCIAGHAAVNSSFQRVTGKVFDSAAVAGSAVSSATMTLVRIASSFIAKFDSLTGTPKIQILRVRDAATYDSSDETFKASPSLANAQMTMTQVDATLWPTYYLKAIDPTGWTDGEYMTHAVDDGDAANYRFDSYIYKNGTLFYGGLLTDERAAVLTSAAQSGLLTDEEHNTLLAIPTTLTVLGDDINTLDTEVLALPADVIAALGAHEYETGFSHNGVWRAIIALLQSAGTFPNEPGNFVINSPTGKARIRGSVDIAGVRTITSIDLTP
jgi:hypothetical protein